MGIIINNSEELVTSNGPKIQMNACLYCDTNFLPKRRWIQKYCSESCRTLACRERKKGIGGTLEDKNKSTSVTDLYHSQINLFSEMKEMIQGMEMWMREIMIITNKINHTQEPELIKSIDRKLSELQSKGLSSMPEQLNEVQLKMLKLELLNAKLLNNQNHQQLLTIISSMFGPIIGEKIWNGIKGLVSDEKEVPMEDKINSIMEIVNKLSKTA